MSQNIALVAKHFVSNQLTFFSRSDQQRPVEYDERLSWCIIGGISRPEPERHVLARCWRGHEGLTTRHP
jgi:hypothetical protein